MTVLWTAQALRDYAYWEAVNPVVARKINGLLTDIERAPFTGLGKPEPLKQDWSGWWSRRISKEHRLVYRVRAGILEVAQCRFHY